MFDWKAESQEGAKRGMSLKVVDTAYAAGASGNLPPGQPFEEAELWITEGVPGKTRLLHHEDTAGWEFDRPYTFRLDFGSGEFRIIVKEDGKTLYDRTQQDSTYPSGRFGFYNYSQGRVVYEGFETRRLPGKFNSQKLVIVAAILLLLSIVAVIVARRNARRPKPGSSM